MLFFSTTTRYSVCAERKWRHITSSLADADIVPAPAAVGLCKQNTTRQMLLAGFWGRWWCANETGISQRWLIYPSPGLKITNRQKQDLAFQQSTNPLPVVARKPGRQTKVIGKYWRPICAPPLRITSPSNIPELPEIRILYSARAPPQLEGNYRAMRTPYFNRTKYWPFRLHNLGKERRGPGAHL
jgi:hypothetical protein